MREKTLSVFDARAIQSKGVASAKDPEVGLCLVFPAIVQHG